MGIPIPNAGGAASTKSTDPFMQFIMKLMAQMQGGQAPAHDPYSGMAQILHPQSRHLGMSGEDITNQKGPYDSGGIDWLKSHNLAKPLPTYDEKGNAVEQPSQLPTYDSKAAAATQLALPGQPVMPPSTGRQVVDPFDEMGKLLPGVNTDRPLPGYQKTNPVGFGPGTIQGIHGKEYEGMVNPNLPDAQRFKDANIWHAIGSLIKNPKRKPGDNVITDETGPRYRVK